MIILLTIPGLRAQDADRMPQLTSLMSGGGRYELLGSFPCVTWPAQATLLTGKKPNQHGVIANGFYWRDRDEVEMWTAGNESILAPQIWDQLAQASPPRTSAAWFPMLSKRCGADFVCMPAPIHNPDGSESLWCYTKPVEAYGEYRDALGHFPLQHFWGPMANIKSSAWIADSYVMASKRNRPEFSYVYLPHLDYAAQKSGPDSEAALAAVAELDALIGSMAASLAELGDITWVVVSEYVITPVDHVSYPNRVLREAGLLKVKQTDAGEELDTAGSDAWALVDHQFSHVFVRNADPTVVARVAELFRGVAGVERVLAGGDRAKLSMDHERSGEVVLVSTPNSWQAYYWWLDDAQAPSYARTVDIHRKPGYDPVELHFDPATKSIPLNAERIGGSHGAPPESPSQRGVVLCSKGGVFADGSIEDVQVAGRLLRAMGA